MQFLLSSIKCVHFDHNYSLDVNNHIIQAPQGVHVVSKHFPRIKIVTSEIEIGLNEDYRVIPGIGEFGDRYFGTDDEWNLINYRYPAFRFCNNFDYTGSKNVFFPLKLKAFNYLLYFRVVRTIQKISLYQDINKTYALNDKMALNSWPCKNFCTSYPSITAYFRGLLINAFNKKIKLLLIYFTGKVAGLYEIRLRSIFFPCYFLFFSALYNFFPSKQNNHFYHFKKWKNKKIKIISSSRLHEAIKWSPNFPIKELVGIWLRGWNCSSIEEFSLTNSPSRPPPRSFVLSFSHKFLVESLLSLPWTW